jgi:predicted Ser/Thr protein kinase
MPRRKKKKSAKKKPRNLQAVAAFLRTGAGTMEHRATRRRRTRAAQEQEAIELERS